MSDVKELSAADQLKRDAGYRAVDDHVRSGMAVGLGTGSTAYFAVERVGLKLTGAPAREGAEIAAKDGTIIGTVTSGGFGPTVNGPVAMGYIDRGYLEPGTEVDVLVRGKARAATITKLPFVPANFYRG